MERCHQEWDAGLIPGGVFFRLVQCAEKTSWNAAVFSSEKWGKNVKALENYGEE